jgi:hypothetical protein
VDLAWHAGGHLAPLASLLIFANLRGGLQSGGKPPHSKMGGGTFLWSAGACSRFCSDGTTLRDARRAEDE